MGHTVLFLRGRIYKGTESELESVAKRLNNAPLPPSLHICASISIRVSHNMSGLNKLINREPNRRNQVYLKKERERKRVCVREREGEDSKYGS